VRERSGSGGRGVVDVLWMENKLEGGRGKGEENVCKI